MNVSKHRPTWEIVQNVCWPISSCFQITVELIILRRDAGKHGSEYQAWAWSHTAGSNQNLLWTLTSTDLCFLYKMKWTGAILSTVFSRLVHSDCAHSWREGGTSSVLEHSSSRWQALRLASPAPTRLRACTQAAGQAVLKLQGLLGPELGVGRCSVHVCWRNKGMNVFYWSSYCPH